MGLATFDEALAYARPLMSDTRESTSGGAILLATWGMAHANLEEWKVAKDETRFQKVQKDSEEERGKRMCVSGALVQIQVERTSRGKVSHGLLHSHGGNLYRFAAVGSSGDLVEGNTARFCGAVIGRYDYQDSGGGTGHAVFIIGMFDIAENCQAQAAKGE